MKHLQELLTHYFDAGGKTMDVAKVARAINQAVKNFVARNPSHLTRIDIVIFENHMLHTFQSNLDISQSNVSSMSSISSDAPESSTSRLLYLEDDVDAKRHNITLSFTSHLKTNIDKVRKFSCNLTLFIKL